MTQYHKWQHLFLKWICWQRQRRQQTSCVCACPSLPTELGSWFWSQNLWLPSGTALEVMARWQAETWTWNQTWTLPPWTTSSKGFVSSKVTECCVEFQIFLGLSKMPKLRQGKYLFQCSSPDCFACATAVVFGTVCERSKFSLANFTLLH